MTTTPLPPLLRIGGAVSPRDGVHVRDLAGRRRSHVDRRTLARAVAEGAAPDGALSDWLAGAAEAGQPDAELVEFWHRRRWRPSLEYHLVSRDLPYADSGPDAVDTRRQVLAGYGGGAALPARIRPEGLPRRRRPPLAARGPSPGPPAPPPRPRPPPGHCHPPPVRPAPALLRAH